MKWKRNILRAAMASAPGSGAFGLGCCHRSWSLRLQMLPPLLEKGVGEGWVSGTASVPVSSCLRSQSGSWSLRLLVVLLLHRPPPWGPIHPPSDAQICVDLLSILVCFAEDTLLGYRCPTGYNLKGRDQGNNSLMMTSPLLLYLTRMLTMLWENSLFCSAGRSFGDVFTVQWFTHCI